MGRARISLFIPAGKSTEHPPQINRAPARGAPTFHVGTERADGGGVAFQCLFSRLPGLSRYCSASLGVFTMLIFTIERLSISGASKVSACCFARCAIAGKRS